MLNQTEEEEIVLYDWLALVVQGSDAAEDEVHSLKRRLDEQEQTNAKLYDQLQGLTEAKLQHEDALLHNFGELINSKKLKIRDQQRLLAGATVDPTSGTCLGYIARWTRDKVYLPLSVYSYTSTRLQTFCEGARDRGIYEIL